MRTIHRKAELRTALADARREGRVIGLVPTMGALHDGHLSLLRVARRECDLVVMSLFVNPAQFGPGEDFARYPRDEARDAILAEVEGVDLIFAPAVEEIYPPGFATEVTVSGLTEVLCGAPASRGPKHFRGVTTVVAKLFNVVQPDVAYFGQKDAQQAIVIKRMVRDLDLPVRIEVLPIVREPDGLAMSSRNAYLGPEARERALALNRALGAAERAVRGGQPLEAALEAAHAVLAEAEVDPEYLEARDVEDLSAVTGIPERPVLIALAATIGGARLIDNVVIEPVPEQRQEVQPVTASQRD